MSRVKKDSFKRLRQLSEVMEARILPILIHGMPAAKCLLMQSERKLFSKTGRMKTITDTLKLSAAAAGVSSLSCIQLGVPVSLFCIHQNIQKSQWTIPSLFEAVEQIKQNKEKDELSESDQKVLYELAHEEAKMYQIYANPVITALTSTQEIETEYCPSYPELSSQVKRPYGAKVYYINQDDFQIDEDLFDFKARVFLHEYDHLNGTSIIDWNTSEGNIDISNEEDKYSNTYKIIAHYKEKIKEFKQDFPQYFEQKGQLFEENGQKWNKTTKSSLNKNIIDFEEAMKIDFIRAARKDLRKQQLKENLKLNQEN